MVGLSGVGGRGLLGGLGLVCGSSVVALGFAAGGKPVILFFSSSVSLGGVGGGVFAQEVTA